MAVTTAAVVGMAASAYGAYNANQQGKDALNAQRQAMEGARTSLGGFNVFGPGGMTGATYDGNVTLNGGTSLNNASGSLSSYANSAIPQFSNQLPAGVQQALTGLQGAQGIPGLDLGGLDKLLGQTNGVFDEARGQLSQAGSMANQLFGQGMGQQNFQSGLQQQLFGNAQQQLAGLGQTYDQAYGNTLSTLRQQAAPEEARQMAGLTDNLFSTGRLGSTGGALQTEAFARGLGQADLSRQLAATGQAQQAQQNALGLAQGQTSMGIGLNQQGMQNMQSMFGMGDNLLNSAYNRFGNTSQLAADLNQARFARSMYGNETQYNRAQNMLGTQVNLAGLPAALQGAQLGNVNQALSGQAGIQSQLMQLFQGGLAAEQAAANARIGAGSNMAQIVGSPSFGAAGQSNAAMWSQLGGSLMNPNGMGGVLGSIFGGGGQQIQSPDAWGALDSALASGQVGG